MRASLCFLLSASTLLFGASCTGTPEILETQTASSEAKLAEVPSTLEEDYTYPGAEAFLDSGITLKSGDGNLLLVDCSAPDYALMIESYSGQGRFCFSIRGKTGLLVLELKETFLIRSRSAGGTAKVVANGQPTTVQLSQGRFTSLVQGSGSNPVYPALVELRLST